MYQSSQLVTEDRQSWGCRRIIYSDYTAPTITPHQTKTSPLCSGVLVSVVAVLAVLAAAAYDSVATTRACCHSWPFSVPDHHHAASLLFCSGNAAGIVFGTGMSLPIPF